MKSTATGSVASPLVTMLNGRASIAAVLDGLGGGGHTADRDGLDGVVQRAEADVADGGLIVGNSGHDAVGAGLDGGCLGGVIDLLAVSVLLLNAGQLNESAAGAGAVLTGDDRDVLIGVKVTCGAASAGAASLEAVVSTGAAEEAAAESEEPQAARLRARAAAVTAAIADLRFMCVYSPFSPNLCGIVYAFRSASPEARPLYRISVQVSTMVRYNRGKALQRCPRFCVGTVKFVKNMQKQRGVRMGREAAGCGHPCPTLGF